MAGSNGYGRPAFCMLPMAVAKDFKLKPRSMQVYAALVHMWSIHGHFNQYDTAPWERAEVVVGKIKLAEESGVSTSTLQSCIKDLEKRGHIAVVRNGLSRCHYRLISSGWKGKR